jgi:tRNA uridine 5-carboxymethylaminomethyl modification enzyme
VIEELKAASLSKPLLKKYGSSNHNLFQLLKRPDVKLNDIYKNKIDPIVVYKIETKVKFEGYIVSQNKIIEKYNKIPNIDLQSIKNYKQIHNLSLEAIDKLNKIKPLTLSQAQRIPGITSNDIIVIKLHLNK